MTDFAQNSNAWLAEDGWWSERLRSRPLLWPVGDSWFINDPLGPKPHTHPDASEIFLVAAGEMMLKVGREDHHVRHGDLIMIPPNTFHEPQAIGAVDLCLLAVISPNLRNARWKIDQFEEQDFLGKAIICSVFSERAMPSDTNLSSQINIAEANSTSDWFREPITDVLIYALGEKIDIDSHHMSGQIKEGEYLHIMAGCKYRIGNSTGNPSSYLIIRAKSPN